MNYVKGVAPTHGFRHGMASAMVAGGIDIKTVLRSPTITTATIVLR